MYWKKLPAKYCYGLSCLLTLYSFPAFSQEPATADSRLYNGIEYIRNGTPAKGFAFFDMDSLQLGTVCYNGLLFHDIPMEYDLVEDKLVIPYFHNAFFISLISEKLSYFYIGNQRFRYIGTDKNTASLPSPGFYQELYRKGSTAALARREKKLVFPSNHEDQARYTQQNTYFLLLDGLYYPISGEKDLLDATKDKKDALRQFIRKNKIQIGRAHV